MPRRIIDNRIDVLLAGFHWWKHGGWGARIVAWVRTSLYEAELALP